MPLGINSYVDPGVYVKQKLQAGSSTFSADRILCVVGIAPRTRRVTDEVVIRGKIYDETLTVSGTAPYRATLANVSNRDRTNATLYRNGYALGLGDWGFVPATLVGKEWGAAAVNVSSSKYLTLSIDNKAFVTIDVAAAITHLSGDPSNASATNVCAAINHVLSDPALVPTTYAIYGADYSNVATCAAGTSNDIITLTSPATTSASSVKIALSPLSDCASIISNTQWAPTATAGVQASTVVQLTSNAYSSTSTYVVEYVAVDSLVDSLSFATTDTPLAKIISVGASPGASSYVLGTDYEITGQTVDWEVDAVAAISQANITSLSGPFTGTGTDLKIAINNLAPITVTLTTGAPNPTAANVVTDINAAFAASSTYGPIYSHVAEVVSTTYVKITAPSVLDNVPESKGYSSLIEFFTGTTSGVTDIFGIASGSLPYEVRGVGKRPDFGTLYYTSYDYTRLSSDYDLPHIVYNNDELYSYCSPLTLDNYTTNTLAIAGEIAFANGVSRLYVTQINDSTAPGTPTPSQVNAAIDKCGEKSDITDVVVINTAEAQAVYLMDHVSTMSSLIEKKYRRGWFGMARNTDVGDPDTPDTFVYRATTTLQPGNTSSGRGRLILCAPANVSRTLTLEDSTEVTVDLDGSYLAVANAAVFVSLLNPSDALLNKTVTGFLTDSSFETYLQAQRYTLASNGVNVTTLEGGRLVLKDPLTTEAGGAKVIEFEEPSSSAQKDAVTRAVEQVIDQNVKGIVPDDLADFIVDIKTWISIAIKAMINNGTIAPFRNADGSARDIDLMTDIQAYQDETDPRSFIFKYWFNLKYVAKRFFGEYSVDNPFFVE